MGTGDNLEVANHSETHGGTASTDTSTAQALGATAINAVNR